MTELQQEAQNIADRLNDVGIVRIPNSDSLMALVKRIIGPGLYASFQDGDRSTRIIIFHAYAQELLEEKD